ncbi:hypothetical protein DEJ50_11565 [Streptomyces venezuelae]|uniref:DUF4253 domain-containing protein n=1 Tax=Streptomyces venezuelae TaxID=54571 RepID=A0A5P2DAZ8_STRVZ|nr:DUF4253 domain-containing protein [Streptomyces venezuelae]QES52344.1 hypothetical protein DEJ50_11565 [Streptomyces venezuelae]
MTTPSHPLSALSALSALPDGLGLPAGSVIAQGGAPLLWLADETAEPGSWAQLRPAAESAGLLPVLLHDTHGPAEWWTDRLLPGRMSDPEDHHVEVVLREYWEAVVPDEAEDEDPEGEGAELIAPFGRSWAGLAAPGAAGADPEAEAAGTAEALLASGRLRNPRLGLVPATRSADIPAAIGWTGPTNHENDTARLGAVLRSWEERYGARVVALGFDLLDLSVAAPPRTSAESLAVAAEHFAFAPDNIWQGAGSLREYAQELPGSRQWTFWWD